MKNKSKKNTTKKAVKAGVKNSVKEEKKEAVKIERDIKLPAIGKSLIPNFEAGFKSLSGKEFTSKRVYLETKLKRGKTKFSLGFAIFEEASNALLKKKVGERVTVKIEEGIDSFIRKVSAGKITSKGIKYLPTSLLTNRDKGYSGLVESGSGVKVELGDIKNFPKTSGNGTINAPASFSLIKV